jgi:tripeptidyl-peptidase-1
MYNITQATKSAKGNELGIFEEGDFYSATDLIEFFATFAKSVSHPRFKRLQLIDPTATSRS